MRRITALLLALCLLLVCFAGCSKPAEETKKEETKEETKEEATETKEETKEEEEAPAEEAESEKRDSLRLATTDILDSTDPHFNTRLANGTPIELMYESLYYVDENVELHPNLATDFTISPDGLVYTYTLKQGVKFHNGEEMKASDVVFSYERAMTSPALYSVMQYVDKVEALDDYTVAITLNQLYSPFNVQANYVSIVSELAVKDARDNFVNTPCGTGPYTVIQWKGDEKITLTRFEDYHGELAKIKDVIISVVSDGTTAMMAFEAGEFDYIGIPKAEYDRITNDGRWNTRIKDGNHTTYMVFNMEKEPFNDVRVRQAFNYAINREEVLLGAMDNLGTVATTIGNPTYTFGCTSENVFQYEYNVEKAKELMAEAGYPDGFVLSEPVGVLPGHFDKAAQIIQQQLAQIGVYFDIFVGEDSTYVPDILNGNFLFSVMGLTLDIDFSQQVRAFGSQAINTDFNFSRYNNPEVDELFQKASRTTDQDERAEYFRQIIDITNRDAVHVPLYHISSCLAWDKDLVIDSTLPVSQWYWQD